ncbi:MAG: DUF192 domain-containing protein [Mangrovicoccus sp.]|nr:DUF192 domain-containing protein [Mangrovicoccus sp.]
MGSRFARRGLIGLFLWALGLGIAGAHADCAPEQALLRGEWGSAQFSVELADTHAERAQGLMFRQELPRNAGMLFVYERPQPVAFWMRNTPLPLDLIFFDERGEVIRIHHQAIPYDETPIPGGGPVLAVLEINGGLAKTYGFAPGDEIQHPSFDPEIAAFPCDG